jgi:endonuclease YncB( thermonuclease family)
MIPPVCNVAPVRSFEAEYIRTVDGDTHELRVDLGFRVALTVTTRLRGVNCPELSTTEGVEALRWVQARVLPTTMVTFTAHGRDKYGRWVGYILYGGASPSTGTDLGMALVSAGMAVPVNPS